MKSFFLLLSFFGCFSVVLCTSKATPSYKLEYYFDLGKSEEPLIEKVGNVDKPQCGCIDVKDLKSQDVASKEAQGPEDSRNAQEDSLGVQGNAMGVRKNPLGVEENSSGAQENALTDPENRFNVQQNALDAHQNATLKEKDEQFSKKETIATKSSKPTMPDRQQLKEQLEKATKAVSAKQMEKESLKEIQSTSNDILNYIKEMQDNIAILKSAFKVPQIGKNNWENALIAAVTNLGIRKAKINVLKYREEELRQKLETMKEELGYKKKEAGKY